MGFKYDPAKQCFKIDVPYRHPVTGNPSHLKATVYGPHNRDTRAKAMRKLLELEERARAPASSLKFKIIAEKYLKHHPQLPPNITGIITHVIVGMGGIKLANFKDEFAKWIKKEEKRNRMVWRRVDGRLKLCDTGKPLSRSTIQAYMRYAKLILRHAGHGEAFGDLSVGRRIARRRPLEPWEMLRLEEACMALYPWFYPAFDFARCNPIRPEDQFALAVELHVREDGIEYQPSKTYRKTGLMAYPLIHGHQREWFNGLRSGLIFPRQDGSSMLGSGKYYQYVWGRIRRAAGLEDVQFYDLRHHAVAWMRAQGEPDWRIIKAAGWASAEMLADYDPDNRHLIKEYDRSRRAQPGVAGCSTSCSPDQTLAVGFTKQKSP